MLYYRYFLTSIPENGHTTLKWDQSIITVRNVVANKGDIVLIDRLKRRIAFVNATVPYGVNLVKAEENKNIKYLDLAHGIGDLWDVD